MQLKTKNRVVVIGGGMAGAEIIRLASGCRNVGLTLIEPKRNIECQALYPDYLGGTARLKDLTAPLFPFCGRTGTALVNERAIQLGEGMVITVSREVEFDLLVIAVGAEPNYFGVKGAEKTFSLNTLEETKRARRFVEDEEPSRIMIIGSGLTGVEAASALADSLESDIYIVEMMDRLMPAFPPGASSRVEKILYHKGVNILTSSRVQEVTEHSINFADGTSLDCDMAIWTSGIKPASFVQELDLPKEKGWLKTDPYLRVKGNVFAIGDCAWIEYRGKLATKTGIEAERQAAHMARNLHRMGKRQDIEPYSVLASTDNPMALISTGCGEAVGILGQTCIPIPAKLVGSLKGWIDKSIIKKYK